MKAVRSSNDAIVVPSTGPVYHGQAGQTRTERVHLVEADNTVRSFEVFRVVNVTSDPELKPRALTGQLHRLPDGRELALPFVYHDPSARKFALVIPSSLAHLEMKEWARLMAEVAEDTSAAVPTYVREGTTVLGLGALELFLEAGSEPNEEELSDFQPSASEAAQERAHALHVREQSVGDREKTLGERERDTSEQQQSLLRMAEDLSARERSLQRREEQIDAARVELLSREQQVENVRGALNKREQEHTVTRAQAAREQQASAAQAEQRVQEQTSAAIAEQRAHLQLQLDALRHEQQRSEQQIGALRTQLRAREQQLERAVGQLAAREQELAAERARARAREREADVVPEGEWQDVAIDARPLAPGGDPAPALRGGASYGETAPALRGGAALIVDEVDTVVAQAPQPPPLPAIPSERGQAAISVPPPAASSQRARARESTPAPAATPVPPAAKSRAPAAGAANQRPSRAPTTRPSDAAAPRTTGSTAPALRGGASSGSTAEPLRGGASSSVRAQAGGRSAAPAAKASTSDAPAHAVATSQRPRATEPAAASQRPRVTEPAAPTSQRSRASESPPSGVRTTTAPPAASRTTSAPPGSARVTSTSNAPALRGGALAPAITAPPRQRSEPPEAAQPLPAEALSSGDLRKRLDDPAMRMQAIRELCRRGHPAAITPIFKVLGALSPEDVATTVVWILALGAGVSGGLVEALESPSQDVRHAAALGLGQLKVPDTLLPLLRRIETETTPSWTEMTRALGDYGGAALAIVVRALPSSDRRERLMVGLAHLANHGCAEDLKSLENDPDSAVALASRQALARCSRMQIEDIAVRTQQPLRDNSPEARFSQVFFATLAAAG